ncbi:MAG: ArsR/SmtB family transcription factor [Alphaproteobacteria bacterium]
MKPTKKQETFAGFFFALSHKRRLMICEILLRHGPTGLSFGTLQIKTRLCASTLGHHLEHMHKGGILRRRIKGTETWLSMDFARLNTIPVEFSNSCQRNVAVIPA